MENKEKEKRKEDWLILKLEKPIQNLQNQIDTLDLTGIRELTLDDMIELYNIYNMSGGEGPVMQESTMLFAKIVTQRVTGMTLEQLGQLSAKDALRLKNRMYRFFYM